MLKADGKFLKYGHSHIIRLDPHLVSDSKFPFKLGDIVTVKIVDGTITIKKKGDVEFFEREAGLPIVTWKTDENEEKKETAKS